MNESQSHKTLLDFWKDDNVSNYGMKKWDIVIRKKPNLTIAAINQKY